MTTIRALLRPLAILVMLSACVAGFEPPTIPITPAERIPPPPAATEVLIWQPGHYDWDGRNYVWITGLWIPRSGHGPLWEDGSWHRAITGWEWRPAHWI